MARIIGLVVVAIVLVLCLWFRFVSLGGLGEHEGPGTVAKTARPAAAVTAETAAVAKAADDMLVSRPKQILFGDLHVHTTFSFDAFMLSLPMQTGQGAHPPADACDFARFCSNLDFWSINDHAESITPAHWRETIDTIRECNAVSGAGAEPDTVAYLGWEWTQAGTNPQNHYGHKNVILRDLEEDKIPTRPIAATGTYERIVDSNPFGGLVTGAALHAMGIPRLHDLAKFFREMSTPDICPLGVPERELPADCIEIVDTPDLLFEKLDDWNVASIVIPHGTTWGFYTPPGSDWAKQLVGVEHDEKRQTLFEIYSGHGNSEQYREARGVVFDENGRARCPRPTPGYLPTCWRAGEIIRERCLADGESDTECESRAVVARQNAADAGGQAHLTVAGVDAADWLDAGQCRDCDLPAFNYRPLGSAQYVLALSNFDTPDGDPRRFRFGFVGSSDNHFGRPGTGFKELHRIGFTESQAIRPGSEDSPLAAFRGPKEAPASVSRAWDPATSELKGFALMESERQSSFFMTGGLVAAHSKGRDRQSIWEAFQRREVYGTTGPRILLWFDLLNPPGTTGESIPMGGQTKMSRNPVFSVRAVGSFEQLPGCPDYSVSALGPERLEHVCMGECANPSSVRRPITRIEVVRIRPQSAPGEPIAPLIDDPWLRFDCDGNPEGCEATFSDPEFAKAGRDTVYYVRAIEAPKPTINGQGIQCERDAEGNCTKAKLCMGSAEDDCLAEAEPRAWSSPIFIDWPRS